MLAAAARRDDAARGMSLIRGRWRPRWRSRLGTSTVTVSVSVRCRWDVKAPHGKTPRDPRSRGAFRLREMLSGRGSGRVRGGLGAAASRAGTPTPSSRCRRGSSATGATWPIERPSASSRDESSGSRANSIEARRRHSRSGTARRARAHRPRLARERPHHDKEHEALERDLVQLRRMARQHVIALEDFGEVPLRVRAGGCFAGARSRRRWTRPGTTWPTAHSDRVTRPASSPLMKLPEPPCRQSETAPSARRNR